jgi:hypothetical protein
MFEETYGYTDSRELKLRGNLVDSTHLEVILRISELILPLMSTLKPAAAL